MQAGCVCKVQNTTEADRRNNVFALDQLVYKSTNECSYLSKVNFKKMFLFHSQTDDRGVFGLFVEGSKEVTVVAVNPNPGQVEAVNLKAVLRSCFKTLNEDGTLDPPPTFHGTHRNNFASSRPHPLFKNGKGKTQVHRFD